MKISALIVSAIALALVVASPAEAAGKHRKAAAGHAKVQRPVVMNSDSKAASGPGLCTTARTTSATIRTRTFAPL